MSVYVLEGWFGDMQWIEGIYARSEDADAACSERWKDRRSQNPDVDDYVQGVCKFAVVEYEVIGNADKDDPRTKLATTFEWRGLFG